MAWQVVVPIVIAAVGMIADFLGSKKSASGAAKASHREAFAERRVTQEKVRQLHKEERTMAGDTRAKAAGSHVKAGQGSPLDVLAEQAKEFSRERQIVEQVGATKAASALQRGRDVGNAVRYQSYSNLATGASNIFSIINSQGQQSKGTPKAPIGRGN
jgi:hypothetical protein